MTWENYHDISAPQTVSKLLLGAVPYVQRRGRALDLGAGQLEDARAMLSAGFGEVIAVDSSAASARSAKRIADPRFRFVRERFETFSFTPGSYDLVHAKNALFFCDRERWPRVFEGIRECLAPGGILAADFLGPKDDWRESPEVLCLSRHAVQAMFADWDEIQRREWEFDEPTAGGEEKHWHYWKIIARKR